jgi:hypothetical protein
MGQRLDLQTALEAIPTVEEVYFQPDQNVKLKYPCIVYERSSINVNAAHADDMKYWQMKRYSVTVIDRNPDSPIVDAVGERQYTELERFFIADGLNHTVFQTFF